MTLVGNEAQSRLDYGGWFWALFWSTILLLALLKIYLYLQPAQSEPRLSTDARERVLVSEQFSKQLELVLPDLLADLRNEFAIATADIEREISREIDELFVPVEQRIPLFLDFHYSVTGEYLELLAAAGNDAGHELQRILFDETDFERRLADSKATIAMHVHGVLAGLFERFRQTLQSRLELDTDEMRVLASVVTLATEDALQRFDKSDLLLKGGGALAGGAAAAATVTKTLGTKMTTKLAAKAAGKTAVKAAGIGGSAASGAVAGLLCGPTAWICAPIAGVAAGIAAWFATDKVVIEVDEYLNRDEFEQELRATIDNMRRQMKSQLISAYQQLLQALVDDNEMKLQDLTTRDLIERTTR